MNRVQAFGRAVKARRLELGLIQTELAVRTALSPASISLIERGASNTGLDSVFVLADALDTTAAELLRVAETVAVRKGKS